MSSKRQNDILQVVKESGSASITGLADRLAVSTETIRRNIKPLMDSGAVVKFHGGVMMPGTQSEDAPFQRRMQVNAEAKGRVAAIVRSLISDGDSLILDNGTTTAYVAEALGSRSGLIVVTNSAEIACRMCGRNDHRVFMAGGELSGDDAAAFGQASVEFLGQFEVKYAIISVGGLTTSGQFANFHLFEAEYLRAAMRQAQETWVVTDASKFGREAPIRVCELSAVDAIICDAPPPAEFAVRCAAAGVRIITEPVN